MNISTLWIQVLTYIAATVGGLVSGYLTSLTGMPPTVSGPVGLAVVWLSHHYLNGLLTAHVGAIADLQATSGFATLTVGEPIAPATVPAPATPTESK